MKSCFCNSLEISASETWSTSTRARWGRPTAARKKVVEDNCNKRKVKETNCSKKMAHCSKKKVVEDNCSKKKVEEAEKYFLPLC